MLSNVHAQGNEVIRVGLIGCGGRGKGAAAQNLRAHPSIRLVAVGDAFEDRANDALTVLRRDRNIANRIDVPDDRKYVGLDAYERVIAASDMVILATPPGFRPIHLRAAVAARKNIFTEKPVCVDGPGFRTCMQAYEDANTNRLSIVAGTQRRYQTGYKESMRRIHDGALGTITSARCYWNQGGLWHAARTENMTDLQWQIRNWLYFAWLSGDHIVEQHVHNLDVINWALGNSHPTKANGMGGRQVRTGPEYGHIFDHFAIDFEYPNNVRVLSMCRQIAGCEGNVSEWLTGTKGGFGAYSRARRNIYAITGDNAWNFQGDDNEPYLAEHVALVEAVRSGRPINDLKNVAESSLTAVMGRMAAYTGREVTWDQAKESTTSLMPANLRWDMTLPVPPVAVPGRA
jgi:myo-inositol 2-dehydrogenase / D-chiro-inositol 1-dehydrogenase